MIEETQVEPGIRQDEVRNEDGTFKKGVSGNLAGRPKNTLKSYISRKFNAMTDEEKEAWLQANKIPAIEIWKMGEGSPHQSSDHEVKGEVVINFAKDFKKDEGPNEGND